MFWNSAFLALVGTVADADRVLARRLRLRDVQSRFRDRIFGFLLLMLSIPFAALMVPLFIMMSKLNLINTLHRGHPARHRLDLHHLLFPPGDQGVPDRAARCRARSMASRSGRFPLRLSAGDALDLCGGDHHRVHGQLEQLPLAADRAADRREQDGHAGRLGARPRPTCPTTA